MGRNWSICEATFGQNCAMDATMRPVGGVLAQRYSVNRRFWRRLWHKFWPEQLSALHIIFRFLELSLPNIATLPNKWSEIAKSLQSKSRSPERLPDLELKSGFTQVWNFHLGSSSPNHSSGLTPFSLSFRSPLARLVFSARNMAHSVETTIMFAQR